MAIFSQFIFVSLLVGLSIGHPQHSGTHQSNHQAHGQCGFSTDYDCVPYFQCQNGVINTDGAGLIDVRVRPQAECVNPDYPDVPAICCLVPGGKVTPKPIETCGGRDECVDPYSCSATGEIVTDGSGLIDIRTGTRTCWQHNNQVGVCCTPPIQLLDYCPGGSSCVPHGACNGLGYNADSIFVDYVQTGIWNECALPHNNAGVCCQPYAIDLCPHDSVCVNSGQCAGTALNHYNEFIDYATTGNWMECNIPGHSYGVCCKQPFKDVQCPAGSSCTTENECLYQALNAANQFAQYRTGGDFGKCYLNSGHYGVCCKAEPTYITCPLDSVCTTKAECYGTAYSTNNEFLNFDLIGSWHECTSDSVCCVQQKAAADVCGIRNYGLNQRIQADHQNEADFGEFPWQAIIFLQNFEFKCGASLISNRHVVTGAHCVDKVAASDIRIRFGEWKVNSFDEPLKYQDKNVANIYIHPGFNNKNLHNDVAVIELNSPIEFDFHINTICVPDSTFKVPQGTKCIATGWGKDSFVGDFQHILKRIELPAVDYGYCQDLLRLTRLGKWFTLDKSFNCAGGEANKDACFGDGGGPLACQDPSTGQYFLYGITAWGIGCGEKDVPGVYVNVPYFADWIFEQVHAGQGPSVSVPGYGK